MNKHWTSMTMMVGALLLSGLCATRLAAQTTAFTYQGRLLQDGLPANGQFDFCFALFSNSYIKYPLTDWLTNTAVQVSDGLFTSTLDFGAEVFDGSSRWLEIHVRTNDNKVAFESLSPRQQITSAPWAIRADAANQADLAETVAPGGVDSDALVSGSVLRTHVQAGAIGRNEIALSAVGGQQLAVGAVGSGHIGEGAVNGGHIAAGAVGGAHLAAGAVGTDHLEWDAVGSLQLAPGAVTSSRLAADTVNTSHLRAASVQSNHLAAGSVHRVHLAPDAVFTNAAGLFGFVPPGGIVLSPSPTPPQPGYTRMGAMDSGIGDAWSVASGVGAPLSTRESATVWTGSELITWGGALYGEDDLNTGARYNPATDTWTSMSTSWAPTGRYGSAAVWTGTEVIIFGGLQEGGLLDGSAYAADGAIYTPATDSWRPVTTNNAPVKMLPACMSFAWTPSGMLIVGQKFEALNVYPTVCFLYDPVADVWTPRSTVNAPQKRSDHSHVWTGTELIVWGGSSSNSTPLAAGMRYRVSDNTWRSVSTIGAPSPRYRHVAVWTGSRMIVWGGWGLRPDGVTIGRLNDGGIYDPASNTWAPLSMIGAPEPRSSSAAVWTGSAMVVWGGSRGIDDNYRSGGVYDLATDTWTPTALSGAPRGRYGHNALWDGNRMLIYSGSDSESYPAQVERLDPTKGLYYLYRWQ